MEKSLCHNSLADIPVIQYLLCCVDVFLDQRTKKEGRKGLPHKMPYLFKWKSDIWRCQESNINHHQTSAFEQDTELSLSSVCVCVCVPHL